MIRHHAAITLLRRGNTLTRRAWPISAAPGNLKPASRVQPQRLLVTSSKSNAPPPPARPTAATARPKDEQKEAIEKAEKLHGELKEMLAAQKARQIEELQQPFGSSFLNFLKSSKPEMVNIFFAFVCVLLAYQIHGMRAGIRKLLAEQEEKDEEIDQLRGLLANLTEDDTASTDVESNDNNSFAMKLAQKCAEVVGTRFEESEKKAGYSWILGKRLASGDVMEMDKLVDKLYPIILNDIQSAVGDAAFTPEELKERRVAALKVENELLQQPIDLTGSEKGSGGGKNATQMGDLMEILEEVHTQNLTDEHSTKGEDESTQTKVRRTRYVI